MLFNNFSIANSKPDCSQYSTKTVIGLSDKLRCLKGLPVKERSEIKKFGDLNPLKPRDKSGKIIEEKKVACNKLTNENFLDLIAKLKCDKKFGYD